MTDVSDFPDWGRFLQPTTAVIADTNLSGLSGDFSIGPFQTQGFTSLSFYLAANGTYNGQLEVTQKLPNGGTFASWFFDNYTIDGSISLIDTIPLLGGSVTFTFISSTGSFGSVSTLWAFTSTAPAADMRFMDELYIRQWNTQYPTRVPRFPTLSTGQTTGATVIAAPSIGAWYLFGIDLDWTIGGGAVIIGANGSAISVLTSNGVSGGSEFGATIEMNGFRVTTAVSATYVGSGTAHTTIRYAPGP